MAVAIVQQASGNTGTGTPSSIDPTLASNDTSGNDLILIVASDATMSTPSGWTLDKSQVNNAGHYVFRKATTGSDDTWNIPVNNASTVWWIAEISGLDTSPFDVAASTGSSTQVTSRSTGTTATTAQADEYLIGSVSQSSPTITPTAPTGWTNSHVAQGTYQSTTKGTGTNVALTVADRTVTSTGAYETTASGMSSSATTGIIVTYKIAAGGTDATPTPTSLQVTSTFDATTTTNDVNATSVQTALQTSATFDAVTVTGTRAILYPTSDVAGTGWDSAPTPSQDLWAQVDEVVASDTDYMFTEDPNP